jgi:anti-anti-sigma factor
MPDRLECQIQRGTSVVTIHVRGPLDIGTSSELRSVVLKCLVEHPTAVVVDVTELDVIDDICLTMFPALTARSAEFGSRILLCAPSGPTLRSLRELGLDRRLTICDTPARAAAEALRGGRPGPMTQRFAPIAESVPYARTMSVVFCRRWDIPMGVAERMQVIVTELAANSVQHAGTSFDVGLRCSSEYVHISVRDGERSVPRIRGVVSADEEGGRGLIIVDSFAQTWGYRPTSDGKITWATVRRRPIGG